MQRVVILRLIFERQVEYLLLIALLVLAFSSYVFNINQYVYAIKTNTRNIVEIRLSVEGTERSNAKVNTPKGDIVEAAVSRFDTHD